MTLDKFYTKENIAEECISIVQERYPLNDFDSIVEPSCGNGSFVKHLPQDSLVYLDIEPEIEGALTLSFYDYYSAKNTIVIGNPPFGRNGKEAIKFFNHASSFASVIAFIVPRTFKRISVQNRLSLDFHLKYQQDIPIGSFIPESMQAKCVFQIWEREETRRKPVVLESTHKDFVFTKDITKATIAVKAYGGTGDCGTVLEEFATVNRKAYHFIICSKTTIDNFKKLCYYPLASDTVRQDSIGQKELIHLYNKCIK